MLKKLSDILSDKASLFIILTAVVTFFFPGIFAWVKGNMQTIILGVIMLTMGLTLTLWWRSRSHGSSAKCPPLRRTAPLWPSVSYW